MTRDSHHMILLAPKIITMMPGAAPIENGALVVRDATVAAVGPAAHIIGEYPSLARREFRNAVLLPGLINLHTHLELPPLMDAVHAKTFPDWAKNLIVKIRKLRRRDFRKAVARNISELVRTGTTTVGDICARGLSPAMLRQSGLRSVVFHEIISMDEVSLISRLRRSFLLLRLQVLLSRDSALVLNSISPHAVFTAAEPVLTRINKIAARKHLVIAMHVAESPDETRLLRREASGFDMLYQAAGWDTAWAPSAKSSFEYLSRIGLLGPHLLAAHAVQAGDADIALLKQTGTSVAHCPRSNHEIGVGRMTLKKFLDAGITVGLGTDSLASSPSLSMWDEMRFAYEAHQADGVTPYLLFQLATGNGAQALRMENEIGSLAPGRKADIIAVGLPKKDSGDLYSDLLRETESCIMSMVNGRMIRNDPGCRSQDT